MKQATFVIATLLTFWAIVQIAEATVPYPMCCFNTGGPGIYANCTSTGSRAECFIACQYGCGDSTTATGKVCRDRCRTNFPQ